MIDFSEYNLSEMQAIVAVLDELTYEMAVVRGYEQDFHIALAEYMRANARATKLVDQQAAEAEASGDPPAIDQQAGEADKVQLSSLYGTCAAEPASALPAEEPDDLQALVDTLSRCSDQLAALALAEDKHFAECSQTEVFNNVTMLRECKQALNNMVSDIRDHYDGLH